MWNATATGAPPMLHARGDRRNSGAAAAAAAADKR